MSAMHHRFLQLVLIVMIGAGAGLGVTSAQADQGPATGKSRATPAATGKARVAQGVIVVHAGSKYGAAELAKMRPHYTTLKPLVRTNTE